MKWPVGKQPNVNRAAYKAFEPGQIATDDELEEAFIKFRATSPEVPADDRDDDEALAAPKVGSSA